MIPSRCQRQQWLHRNFFCRNFFQDLAKSSLYFCQAFDSLELFIFVRALKAFPVLIVKVGVHPYCFQPSCSSSRGMAAAAS
mmetsp:Transcript_15519/g.32082  ORF Transcript_15519/g.32082 Transcript_15519/m.32082 type:complete len:81 (+) Transcript_15519:347-589(+)